MRRMRHLLPVGEIVGVHGVKGAVKVRPHSDEDSVYRTGSRVVIKDAAGGETACTIEWATRQKRMRLVRFENISQRERAEELVGGQILADRKHLPELAEGEYYWDQLIGLSVHAVDGQYLGRLQEVIATGANDVYVVRDGKKETLVPALEWVVREIDLAQGLMRVELPEGL